MVYPLLWKEDQLRLQQFVPLSGNSLEMPRDGFVLADNFSIAVSLEEKRAQSHDILQPCRRSGSIELARLMRCSDGDGCRQNVILLIHHHVASSFCSDAAFFPKTATRLLACRPSRSSSDFGRRQNSPCPERAVTKRHGARLDSVLRREVVGADARVPALTDRLLSASRGAALFSRGIGHQSGVADRMRVPPESVSTLASTTPKTASPVKGRPAGARLKQVRE